MLSVLFKPLGKPTVASRPTAPVALWAAFTIWVAITVMLGFLGCTVIPLLLVANALTGYRFSIAPRLSTGSLSDRIAWVAFTIGVWTMLWITLRALLGEGDGDFRTWDEIRRQVRILLVGGFFAIGVPVIVIIVQYLGRPGGVRSGRAPGFDNSQEPPASDRPGHGFAGTTDRTRWDG